MDHEPLPTRPTSPALRWVVAVLLAVIGSAGLVPAMDADEIARVHQTVVVDRHERRVRPAQPRRRPARSPRRPRVLAALAARVRPLVARVEAQRGPPRTPCVVALT